MGTFLKNRQIQSGSTAIQIPIGDTTNRPTSPVYGMIRFNTGTGYCEFFNGTQWEQFGVGGSVVYVVDTFTGNGSATIFGPMSQTVASGDEDQIIVFVGSIYQVPGTAYTTDGTTNITFTSAPPNGMTINVIFAST